MALQLSDLITGARARHASFEKRLVPDASFARFFTGYQRELVSRGLAVHRDFLTQQASIAFDLANSGVNAVGVVGAGTAGGLPGLVSGGVASVVQAPVGSAVELDVDVDATVHHAETPVTSAASLTLTYSGAAWTGNEHAARTVVITGGLGAGQRRTIASNTTTQVTVTEAWATVPDDTSTFTIVTPVTELTETMGAVASAPFLAERRGYLVRLTAGGVAYLDLTTPLVARYAVGIPLPPHHLIVGGDVRFTDDADGSESEPLSLVDYRARQQHRGDYVAYIQNGELFLVGGLEEWEEVESIDLRYVPIPPTFTALTDYVLLPDTCYQAMVDAGALFAAERVSGLQGVGAVDPRGFREDKRVSADLWVREVSLQKRRAVSFIKPW